MWKPQFYILNFVAYVMLIYTSTCYAQLNPLEVTVTMHGDVKVELPLPFMYYYQSSLVSINPDAMPIKLHTYSFRSDKDSTLKSIRTPNLSKENVMLFTFYNPKPIELIYNLYQYKLDTVGTANTYNLTYFEGAIRGHAYDRPQSEYKLQLKYSKNQLLQKIKLEQTTVTKVSSTKSQTTYKFNFTNNRLKSIKNEGSTIKYEYDSKGNVISVISYTGKLKDIYHPYLCSDSLERYFDNKIPTYEICDYYRSDNTDIHVLVFYEYVQNKVTKMVSYTYNGGINKTKVAYDSLGRVSIYREYNDMGGLEMKFEYDENGKVLLRNERRISNSFRLGSVEDGIMETYKYNLKKTISEVTFYYGTFHFNETNNKLSKNEKSFYFYNGIDK
jgi:YD repeat-containing protein